jgi:outer membrane protein OmpA-like peptidoglycan-associated protein
MSGTDFNALFKPLNNRAHIIQFDSEATMLDDPGQKEVEKVWTEKGGASFFFVVARASPDGDAEYNTQLSQQRAEAVMNHLQQKFPGDEDISKVGLLWLGEDYAQLDTEFCKWQRSRSGSSAECTAKDINRSAFVAWIDCAI